MLKNLNINQEKKGGGHTPNPVSFFSSQVLSTVSTSLLRKILAVSGKEQPERDHFK